jgi:hypothetical protein
MNKNNWNNDEILILCDNYSKSNYSELLSLFPSRTIDSIRVKAKRLKLKKDKETEFKNRSRAHKGDKNSMWGKISKIRGKKYDEYYGREKSKSIKLKLRINAARHKKTIPCYNKNACEYFNNLMKENSCFIKHDENGGEFYIKELGYYVDGYDSENNIVYEWDEKQHFRKGILRNKDIIRQNEIIDLLECDFIRIKESDIL